jgi:hypothetical protein
VLGCLRIEFTEGGLARLWWAFVTSEQDLMGQQAGRTASLQESPIHGSGAEMPKLCRYRDSPTGCLSKVNVESSETEDVMALPGV